MYQHSNVKLLQRLKASIRKSPQRSSGKIIALGVAAAAWISPSAALAQVQINPNLSPQTDCYVEWTVGDRTNLQSICQAPATSPQSSSSQTQPSASRQPKTEPKARNSPTAVEITSETGSTVYVNGVRISAEAPPSRPLQPSFNLPADESTYFQYPQTNFSRRYIQRQRFYPYRQLEGYRPEIGRYPYYTSPDQQIYHSH